MTQFEIREQLRLVKGRQLVNCLKFHYQPPTDDDVQTVTTRELDAFVSHRQWYLALPFHVPLSEFKAKTLLVRGLQQTGAKLSMYFNGGAKNLICKGVTSSCHDGWLYETIRPVFLSVRSATKNLCAPSFAEASAGRSAPLWSMSHA